jgi:hypothetical protein
LLRSQYSVSEQEVLILGPQVYQQLLERMADHLQGTHQGGGRGSSRQQAQPRTPTRSTARQQQQEQELEEQQQQEAEQQELGTLLEQQLYRVLGQVSTAAAQQTQATVPWQGWC